MPDHQHWLDRWNENRIGFHQVEVNAHLSQYLPQFDLSAGSSIFMPLCGKAHDIAWIADQGFKVIGIEISQLAIEAFFRENELQYQSFKNDRFVLYTSGMINLIQGDFFDLHKEDIDDCKLVYDRAAMIAMDPSQRSAYCQHMKSIMPASSDMLLITMEYQQSEMPGPPYAVLEDEVDQIYSEAFKISLLQRDNIIDESPRWRKAGLSKLDEAVYRMTRHLC